MTARLVVASAACSAALAACAGGHERAATTPALGLTRELPDTYRRVCAKQARRAPPGARSCPPLIPRGAVKVLYAGVFSKPPEYRGGHVADLETNGVHWHYDVSWTPTVRRLAVGRVERPPSSGEPSTCRNLTLRRESVEACRVVPYERGGGLHGGHVAYVWRQGRATYVVSVHGYANEHAARAMTGALIEKVATR